MISYSNILYGLAIIFMLGVVFMQVQLWRHRDRYDVRRKYMYMMIGFMILAQGAMYLKIKLGDTKIEGLKPKIQTQLNKLDEVEQSLSDLKTFVESQKYSLRESEARLRELNQEQEKLKPIVEADRKTIKALFLAQEERNRSEVWSERFIGAFFGILSSLVAALIFKLVTTRKSSGSK